MDDSISRFFNVIQMSCLDVVYSDLKTEAEQDHMSNFVFSALFPSPVPFITLRKHSKTTYFLS